MMPLNQLTMGLSQEDYNDFLEFQKFKKFQKITQEQFKAASAMPQFSPAAAAAAAGSGFNQLFNSPNSIFPMTSTATIPTTSIPLMAAQFQHHHQQQHHSQPSTPIIPKVMPQMPLPLMRQQPSTAASFLHYKNNINPNFPGLKGGASSYTPPSAQMFMPPSMPIQTMTPKVATPLSTPTPKRAASPEIIVDDEVPTEKRSKLQECYESFLPKLSSHSAESTKSVSSIATLPSIDTSSYLSRPTASSIVSLPSSSSSEIRRPSDSYDSEETHIIITARPRVPESEEKDETYTSEDESDYDTNLRPKETPLQYKERMMERVMDKAKRKNEASKRSREKRKREHQDRQVEKQRLEKRNMELTEKLMNLKEALKRLRPQICGSCNEQVQKFLDQCQSSKEGMNVFVLRPCKQDKCPGNKSVGREIGRFAAAKSEF